MMRKNTKGISYVELIIVMAMLAALMGISSISFSSAWRARASKAASTSNAMISQSKINSMSGDENYFELSYKEKDPDNGYDEDGYYCEIYREGSSTPYKTEKVGNSRLTITAEGDGENRIAIEGDKSLRIKFVGKNGSVDYAGIYNGESRTAFTDDSFRVYFSFGGEYCIEVWKVTGEHSIV